MRFATVILVMLTVLILADAARYWLTVAATPGLVARYAAVDYTLYMQVARDWLAGAPLFSPHQVAGPYAITAGDVLYPPASLYLFVPFTVLPAAAWWIAPVAIVAWAVWRMRPSIASWPLIALCAWWPTSGLKVLTGNPVMWVVAAVALGCLHAWPFVFALLKPSLFPFALLGARSRQWWMALGIVVLACLPFGSLWLDWVHALLNSRAGADGGGLLYSTQEIPLVCLPLAAWLGSKRSWARRSGHRPNRARISLSRESRP